MPTNAMTRVAMVAMAVGSIGGCASNEPSMTRGLERAERSVGTTDRARSERAPVALIRGSPVDWSEIRGRLMEVSGREVVEEVALEHILEGACRREGVTIGEAEIERENELLGWALVGGSGIAANPEEAARMLARVRRDRGLGPERFRSLLYRNAMLRGLVADEVEVSEEAVRRMHARLYGPDYPCRVIVVRTAGEATLALRRVRGGEDFGAVAAELSIDESAARGGLIDPINEADASWPMAMRRVVTGLRVGEVSEPVVLDRGLALLWLESAPERKAEVPLESARTDLELMVRLDRERTLMAELARELREDAELVLLDPGLSWGAER